MPVERHSVGARSAAYRASTSGGSSIWSVIDFVFSMVPSGFHGGQTLSVGIRSGERPTGKIFGVLGCSAQQEGENIFARAPHCESCLLLGELAEIPAGFKGVADVTSDGIVERDTGRKIFIRMR